MKRNTYEMQTELLLRVLPLVMREDVFALKGGTAINLFWRDYPRLSVDIDLTYLPVRDRDSSILDINDSLVRIQARIESIILNINVTQKRNSGQLTGLVIRRENATVKIDTNAVIRGTVFPIVKKSLSARAEHIFEMSITAATLSFEDLYGGKICAALNRQHPRDLFDIKILLENEGISEKLRKAFIVYLISHPRPIVELLDPGIQDIKQLFENEFTRMTNIQIELEELIRTREELIEKINLSLSEEEKDFLISFKSKQPIWEKLGLENVENLPAVKWKLVNLERMSEADHKKALNKLKHFFQGKK